MEWHLFNCPTWTNGDVEQTTRHKRVHKRIRNRLNTSKSKCQQTETNDGEWQLKWTITTQWKRNHNNNLWMRDLFVITWLIARGFLKCYCGAAAQTQAKQTSARALASKRKQTEDYGNKQKQTRKTNAKTPISRNRKQTEASESNFKQTTRNKLVQSRTNTQPNQNKQTQATIHRCKWWWAAIETGQGAKVTKRKPMEHKSNIKFKNLCKGNHNHNLWMRHLFVTTWLIARDFQKYGCYLAAPKANKANETTQRKTHESKQKQTKENRSTQQQPTAKQMLSCRTRENNKRKLFFISYPSWAQLVGLIMQRKKRSVRREVLTQVH